MVLACKPEIEYADISFLILAYEIILFIPRDLQQSVEQICTGMT